jgi:hypothetical protein
VACMKYEISSDCSSELNPRSPVGPSAADGYEVAAVEYLYHSAAGRR